MQGLVSVNNIMGKKSWTARQDYWQMRRYAYSYVSALQWRTGGYNAHYNEINMSTAWVLRPSYHELTVASWWKGKVCTSSVSMVGCFDKFRYIDFAMHLDIYYIYVHSKIYIYWFAKTNYNLEWIWNEVCMQLVFTLVSVDHNIFSVPHNMWPSNATQPFHNLQFLLKQIPETRTSD
jgi:hypothetical protein